MEAPRRAALEPDDEVSTRAARGAAEEGLARFVGSGGYAMPAPSVAPAYSPGPPPSAPAQSAYVPDQVSYTPVPPAAPPVQSAYAPVQPAYEPSPPLAADPPVAAAEPDDLFGGDDDEAHRGHGLRTLLTLLIVLAVLGTAGYFGYTKGLDWVRSWHHTTLDYPGPGTTDVVVTIPMGAGSGTMATLLVAADVVASEAAFTDAVRGDPLTFTKIQAGDHALKTKMSGVQALTALADPALVVQRHFTVPDGLTLAQMLDRISQQTRVPLADLQAAAANPASLGVPSWAEFGNPGEDANAIQGYLYPDTYSYDSSPTAQEVLGTMVAQFVKVTTANNFVANAQAQGLRPAQALVLASIIEKEGADPRYASDISQVFHNRLAQGMPFQSDATVLYALSSGGTLKVTNEMTRVDSPYNTYNPKGSCPGLPPGPIANPGKVALTAAVTPTKPDDPDNPNNPTQCALLFFVAVNPSTGETKFACDDAGHAANQAEFQQWCSANPGKC